MKKNIAISALFLLSVNLFSQNLNVGILSGPSAVPACKIMENPKTDSYEISFEKFATPQNLLPKIIKKEIDIAFLPVNVAVKTFNTAPESIVLLAVTGNGNIFLIATDEKVNKISDLKGKKVQVAGQGATPDYLFRYLLEENEMQIGKEGVSLDFSIPNAQIAPMIVSGKIDYAVVPEPFVTIAKTKSKNVRVAVDFQSEYKFFSKQDRNYPLTVMVAQKDFAKNNPNIIEEFLQKYEESYIWTVNNPTAAGKLCEKLDLGLSSLVVAKSVPNANYTFINAKDSRVYIEEFLKILSKIDRKKFDSAENTLRLPNDGFYYERKNFSENLEEIK